MRIDVGVTLVHVLPAIMHLGRSPKTERVRDKPEVGKRTYLVRESGMGGNIESFIDSRA